MLLDIQIQINDLSMQKSRINLIGHGLWSIAGNKPIDEFINQLNLV